MRGKFEDQGGLFSYVSPEARVPTTRCAKSGNWCETFCVI
jgi:hypothetical protein